MGLSPEQSLSYTDEMLEKEMELEDMQKYS